MCGIEAFRVGADLWDYPRSGVGVHGNCGCLAPLHFGVAVGGGGGTGVLVDGGMGVSVTLGVLEGPSVGVSVGAMDVEVGGGGPGESSSGGSVGFPNLNHGVLVAVGV